MLGRHGERPGSLRQTLDVTGHDGVPVLCEELEVGPGRPAVCCSAVPARSGSVLVLGDRLPGEAVRRARASTSRASGTMVRRLAADAHLRASDAAWQAARDAVS